MVIYKQVWISPNLKRYLLLGVKYGGSSNNFSMFAIAYGD